MSVLHSTARSRALTLRLRYQQLSTLQLIVRSCKNIFSVFPRGINDMHFVYGFFEGNARAAVDEYHRRFPDRRIPSRGVFSRIHQRMRETGCLPSVAVQSERVVPLINTRENILEMVQRSPHLSTRRIAPRISVTRTQVWRTLREEELHPYYDHRVQHREQGTLLNVWICATG